MNKISENKIKEIIEDLRKYKSLNNKKHKANYYYQAKQNIIDSEHPIELIKEFLDIYSQCKRNITTKEEVETDDRAVTEVERDENGNIQYYTFEIFRKDSPTLRGKLDRKEMETIYKLYSYYGANLTQKIVSREFPNYTFVEFKRILRAFNIYKANSEFAPHQVEELTEEQLINLHNQNKENNVLRRLEKDQLSEANKLINKLVKENQELSKPSKLLEEALKYVPTIKNSKPKDLKGLGKNTAIIWLSDLHIGAYNETFGFYQLPEYDENEILRRLDKIIDYFSGRSFDNLIVVDLGDSIDQFKKETTRGGHSLPNNMTDKEMSHLYLNCMSYFFNNLHNVVNCGNFMYYSIGESNHSGDFGWALNLALSYKLQNSGWKTYVSNCPIDWFETGEIAWIYLHGKDNQNQYKQFPLTLNPQTELYFNNFIIEHGFTNRKVFVVKGDLHQYAYTSGKQFDYISVGSMYATSNYIAANWGNTPWSINYTIIDNGNVQFGKISD